MSYNLIVLVTLTTIVVVSSFSTENYPEENDQIDVFDKIRMIWNDVKTAVYDVGMSFVRIFKPDKSNFRTRIQYRYYTTEHNIFKSFIGEGSSGEFEKEPPIDPFN